MSEERIMTEENKKTVISFICGLLVGGLLVFVFANPTATNAPTTERTDQDDQAVTELTNEDEEGDVRESTSTIVSREVSASQSDRAPEVSVTSGNASVRVTDQAAGSVVEFHDAVFPTSEGWVGVRDYRDGQLTGLLGAARWNQADGLLPTSVHLLRPMVPGETYAIVFYSENGDRVFSLATDAQFAGLLETFRAE